MIKYLIAILLIASTAYSQTIKNLSYNATNGKVISPTNLVWTNAFSFDNSGPPVTSQFRSNIGLGINDIVAFGGVEMGVNAQTIRPWSDNGGGFSFGWRGSSNILVMDDVQLRLGASMALAFSTNNTNGAAITRTNLGLGATNNVVFNSVSAGSVGTGIRQSGLDGVLRLDAGTLERARLTPTYQFVLLGTNGNLAFGPDNTQGATITRSNLGLVGSGLYSSVGGGISNVASGEYSVVAGGSDNTASGAHSFAAGTQAKATNSGAFVWGDNQNVDFESTTTNSFNIRASGGAYFDFGAGGISFIGNNSNAAISSTKSNLGIYPDILAYWTAKDSADTYIASSVTGGASVTASYGDGVTVLTNPSGRGLPFYRFNIPAVNPRTNSDMAAIRSAWGSQAYFSGPVRTRIDWSENKYIYMRLASPTVGGGTFQFTFGETTTPTFSTNVNGQLPVPSETFIGFRLTRSGTPAFWVPTIITRTSSGGAIITNTGGNMSTNLIGPVNRLLLSYEAGSNPAVSLYSLSFAGSKSLVASYTNAAAFTNSTNAHQVNWLMGITPTPPSGTNTVGLMTYDVEPPIIVQ